MSPFDPNRRSGRLDLYLKLLTLRWSIGAEQAIKRREFIALIGGAVAAWPLAARAQLTAFSGLIAMLPDLALAQQPQVRICQVSPWEGNEHLPRAFERRLQELEYINGKSVTVRNVLVVAQPKAIEDKIVEILPETDLLVVWGTVTAVAAKKIATAIPIVFLSVGVPVDIGLVSSLNKPGGNLTGVTFEAATETYGLRLQMLKEFMPNMKSVGVLKAKGDPNVVHAIAALEKAVLCFGIGLSQFEVGSSNDCLWCSRPLRRVILTAS
jgi:putative ABC transport system substrate-binding protein